MSVPTKRCSRCGETASIETFTRRADSPDGHDHYCRACNSARMARYRAENREALLEGKREWYARNRVRHRATGRAWRAASPERQRMLDQRNYQENREAKLERQLRYHRSHRTDAAYKAKRTEIQRRRDARKRGATIGKVDYRAVLESSSACGICGGPVASSERTVDHIVPLARGGAHAQENLQMAHRKCNVSKGARW